MKNIIVIFGLLFLSSCASLSTQAQSNAIIVERGETKIEFYTEIFKSAKIALPPTNMRNSRIEFAPADNKSKVLKLLRENLSINNFNFFEELSGLAAFNVGLIIDQDKKIYDGFSVSIRNRNVSELNLSQEEMKNILNSIPEFLNSVEFEFAGNPPSEFKTVIYFTFPINNR